MVENKLLIKKAISKKGKFILLLMKDDYKINGKTYFTIKQYDYDSLRESSDVGHNKIEAISRFRQYIKDWNKYNTTIGKLYEK